MRVILNRHPQLAMFGIESHFFRRVYARRSAFGDPGDVRNRERVVAAYLAIEPIRKLGIDLGILRERMLREGVTWPALFASMLQAYAGLKGKPYAGEKTPLHALHANTLCEWFPGCSIIHIVRDPRAMLGALKRMPWATHSALMSARMWRLLNAGARAVSARENYFLVKYEDLVARPEEQLGQLCRHIGLDYHETMLQPNPAEVVPRPEHRRSYEGITAARVTLWREELEPWQVSAVEAVAGREMEAYGYERETKRAAPADMARATVEALVESAIQLVVRSPSAFYGVFQPANLADEQMWMDRASMFTRRLRMRQADRP